MNVLDLDLAVHLGRVALPCALELPRLFRSVAQGVLIGRAVVVPPSGRAMGKARNRLPVAIWGFKAWSRSRPRTVTTSSSRQRAGSTDVGSRMRGSAPGSGRSCRRSEPSCPGIAGLTIGGRVVVDAAPRYEENLHRLTNAAAKGSCPRREDPRRSADGILWRRGKA